MQQDILAKAAATIEMKPTTFKTGSTGFRGQGKVMEGDVKYQVQILAVKCGSKPNGNGKAKKH
jgi:hypothetical protein